MLPRFAALGVAKPTSSQDWPRLDPAVTAHPPRGEPIEIRAESAGFPRQFGTS
jgi:hypothetical protein